MFFFFLKHNEHPHTHHPSLGVKHYKLTKLVEVPIGLSLISVEFPYLPLPEITILNLVFLIPMYFFILFLL